MEEQMVDADNKIVVSCPKCCNQNAIYLIVGSKIQEGMNVQWCDSCCLPYIVDIKTKLLCEIEYYTTERVKNAIVFDQKPVL